MRHIDNYLELPHTSTQKEEIKNCDEERANVNQLLKTNQMLNSWYCNKTFEKGLKYDDHYSQCYDNYTYMHL